MRQYLLDSWLLFYNAMFRPTRLQAQLNRWILPEGEEENTSWKNAVIRLDNRAKWKVWLRCLPWWGLGPLLLGLLGRGSFAWWELLALGLILIATGWGMSRWSPPLGFIFPLVSAAGMLTVPEIYPMAINRFIEIWWTIWPAAALLFIIILIIMVVVALTTGDEGCVVVVVSVIVAVGGVVMVSGPLVMVIGVVDIFTAIVAVGVTIGVGGVVAVNMMDMNSTGYFVGYVVAVVMGSVVTGGIVGGVAGGALASPLLAWSLFGLVGFALGRRPQWFGGLLLVGILAGMRWENVGWQDGLITALIVSAAYARLPLAALAWMEGQFIYRRLKRGDSPFRLAQWLPPFSDETVWLKVPHLDDLLATAIEKDYIEGMGLVDKVLQSQYQRWAASPTYVQITAQALIDNCQSAVDIPIALEGLTWLPDTPDIFGNEFAAVWPRLQAIGQDVAAALDSDSPYSRRLGFDNARQSLNRLKESLPSLGKTAVERWTPVIDHWVGLLDEELAHPLLDEGQQIINPYHAGNPLNLRRPALFRGRRQLTETVVHILLERNRPTLALYGPRRMGKSSLLLNLPRLLPGSVIPVYVDLQRPGATNNTEGFLLGLAKAIATEAQLHRSLVLPPPRRDEFRRSPFGAFSDWLDDEALPALKRAGDFNLLLCFDEFEKLGEALAEDRIDGRVRDELRHTIQHRQAVSLLFAGVQTLDDLGPNWSSYFISVRPLRIGYLSAEEAAGLIRDPDPQSGFNMVYEEAAVADIIAATRCHPYLVQLVCSAAVVLANRERTLLATRALVAQAQTEALEMGDPYFRNLWDESTGPDEASRRAGRRMLRRVAGAAGPVPLDPATPEAHRALDRLLQHRVLEAVEGGHRFEVELVRRWMAERAPRPE